MMKWRYEKFGGIVASEDPPFLAMVDRQFMRELGLAASPLWEAGREEIGVLSAPTEVHLAATNVCGAHCPHCYMDAGAPDAGQMDTPTFKRALRVLAEFGVFHVALGGGEALEREDLFELAGYARELGLVPNLTVSGRLLTHDRAAHMARLFGQVNVSLDGVGVAHEQFRGERTFATADAAVEMLVKSGVSTGINCVLGARNFDGLPDLFAYAKNKQLNEIEFLRFKPAGRARSLYERERMSYEQNVQLLPVLQQLSQEHGVQAKIDCSFVPMLCEHNPPRALLEATATYGCEAGNVLLGIRSDGTVGGCSFLGRLGLSVFDLPGAWTTHEALRDLRDWHKRAPEPCASCEYLDVCKGGCRAVAEYVCGSIDAPDPDCPRVVRAGGQVGSDQNDCPGAGEKP